MKHDALAAGEFSLSCLIAFDLDELEAVHEALNRLCASRDVCPPMLPYALGALFKVDAGLQRLRPIED